MYGENCTQYSEFKNQAWTKGRMVETRNCRCWLTKKGQSAGVTVVREHPWRTWVGDVSGQDPSSNPWTKVDRK